MSEQPPAEHHKAPKPGTKMRADTRIKRTQIHTYTIYIRISISTKCWPSKQTTLLGLIFQFLQNSIYQMQGMCAPIKSKTGQQQYQNKLPAWPTTTIKTTTTIARFTSKTRKRKKYQKINKAKQKIKNYSKETKTLDK